MNQDLKPIKSFWDKPQGTTGMIGIGLLVFGAGYLLLSNAAWLAAAMSNLTTAVFLGIGLFSLIWILSDPKVRTLIWYFYKSMVEKITGVFVEIDPIGGGKVKLTADHINPHSINPNSDPNDPEQWQALCGRHQVMKKNYWDSNSGKMNMYAIIQSASEKEKQIVFKFLLDYFGYIIDNKGTIIKLK